jgi:nicotinamidase-related amidase
VSALDQRRIAALGASPALVVVDVQRSFADPDHLAAQGIDTAAIAAIEAATTQIGRLVDEARALSIPVVWVELVSDPERPWRASGWLHAGDPDAPYDQFQPCVAGTPGAQWYAVAPAENEIRVVKRGYSGFLGTDLADRLRRAQIDWLVVTGLTTECCVDATATDAFQLDWPVLVPRDASAANTPELHENALVQLGLNSAVITTTDDAIALFRDRAEGGEA